MAKSTKLIMTLLVRNEEAIVEDNICFHLNHGVDFVIATDNGSTDATPQILKKYEKLGLLHYINEPEQTYEQGKWVSRMAKIASHQYGATHLFHNDADEFWMPSGDSLKSDLPNSQHQVFHVQRYNFIPTNTSKRGWQVFGYRIDDLRKLSKLDDIGIDKALRDWLILYDAPKIISTSDYIRIPTGMHDVYGKRSITGKLKTILGLRKSPSKVEITPTDNIKIYHFPIWSYEQFKNKVIAGSEAYLRGPYANDPMTGWHWKGWYRLYQRGQLKQVYNKIILKGRIEELQKQRTIKKASVPAAISQAKKIFQNP